MCICLYVCICVCVCLCLCVFGTLNGNYAAPVAEKNTGRVCRILLFDLGFSSFIPFKCHVAATHVCAYTQIYPPFLCMCAIYMSAPRRYDQQQS